MNGKTEVVEALIEHGADVKAKEKVRRRHCVSTGVGQMTKECLGPDCVILAPQGVSVSSSLPVPMLFKRIN
jgi:hypothetical protein